MLMAQAIYVVVHIDVMNAHIDAAEALIKQHAADSRKDPGCVRFESTQETGRRNHFTVIEVWKDKDALDAHEAAAYNRQWREKVQPMLGGPLDSRLHYIFA
jgi:quinol monooxygenase YgiN